MKTSRLFKHFLLYGSLTGGLVLPGALIGFVLLAVINFLLATPVRVTESGETMSTTGATNFGSDTDEPFPDNDDDDEIFFFGVIFYALVVVPFFGGVIGLVSAFVTCIAIKVFLERHSSSTKLFQIGVASVNSVSGVILIFLFTYWLVFGTPLGINRLDFSVLILLLSPIAIGFAVTGHQMARWYLKEIKAGIEHLQHGNAQGV